MKAVERSYLKPGNMAGKEYRRVVKPQLHGFTFWLTISPSCPSVLDAKGLARSFFNWLWEVCSQWQKQVPLTAQAPQRQWLVSIHAIRNTRRKMEDRHVSLPTFNHLFGLSVSVAPAEPRNGQYIMGVRG